MMEQILSIFVSNAYADPIGTAAQQGGGVSFIIMLVIFFLFFYLVIWRPQNKRAKEQQSLMNSLAKGDEVLTAGGMLGRISKMSDQYVSIGVANNVEIVLKSSVVSVLP